MLYVGIISRIFVHGLFTPLKGLGGVKSYARLLATGTQCPTCLRHYTTDVKLCRDLKYSTTCRRPLLSDPGALPNPVLFCAPTLQAFGPLSLSTMRWGGRLPRSLIACTISCTMAARPALTFFDRWARIRASFSCVCLPLCHLRCAAQIWREGLSTGFCVCQSDQGRALPEGLPGRLRRMACPGTQRPQEYSSICSDRGETVAELLDFSAVRLLPPSSWSTDSVLVCIGCMGFRLRQALPRQRFEFSHRCAREDCSVCISLTACLVLFVSSDFLEQGFRPTACWASACMRSHPPDTAFLAAWSCHVLQGPIRVSAGKPFCHQSTYHRPLPAGRSIPALEW